MDRRKSLKTLFVGGVSTSLLVEACKLEDKKSEQAAAANGSVPAAAAPDRMPEEVALNEKLAKEKFFTEEEMATIAILSDIILPKDEVSGSATDAKVPDFIEFIVKDMPENQTPMRGGLRWLDLQSLKRFDKSFRNLDAKQQLSIVDDIAFPEKAKPEHKQGVAFFTLIRNLTLTGFYTTEMGWKDVGYVGNRPNQWNGVPADVLKQYNMAYSEKELKECVSFDKTT